MLYTTSLITVLLGALLSFTDLTSAVPPKPIMPHRTLAFREATVSTEPTASINSGSSSSARLSASNGFSNRSSNQTTSNSPTTTTYIMTETDEAGLVFGCTGSLTTQPYISAGVSTQTTFCIGGGVPLSTDTAILNAWNAQVSSLAPVSVPASGCAIGTDDGASTQYCTCVGSGTLSASSVSTILGFSSGTLTTACNTAGSASLPTGYVEVPAITDDNTELWAQTPDPLAEQNCLDGKNTSATCWQILEMDSYVEWWGGAFNATCNRDRKPFGDCFLEAMGIATGTNCSNIASGQCLLPDWYEPFESQWNGLRNYYVAYNIFNMNSFMNSYYTAISIAQTTASEKLGSIISIIDPIKKTNVDLNKILTAFSVGLAFIPGPEAYLGQALITGAQQAPGVAKFLFPEGTADSQNVEKQEISQNLGNTVTNLQSNVAQALQAMMYDNPSFAAFATTGAFSAQLNSVDQLSKHILLGLNAYLISQAYQENGVFLTRQLNTSVRALMTNGTDLSYQLSCTENYDNNSVCDTFWYDSVDDITYALTSGDQDDGRNTNYNSDMNTWFNDNFTTPELLFRGAANCAAASKANQGSGPLLTISDTDFNTDCLSNMKVCTWSMTPGDNDTPFFSDCNETNSFTNSGNGFYSGQACQGTGTDCGTGSCTNVTPYLRAFRQYLGWGVNKQLAKANGVVFCSEDSGY